MSVNTSPVHYNGVEDAFITDANFKVDISQRMKVPHKISLSNDFINGADTNGTWTSAKQPLDMKVPPRILVAGQNQHIGATATPREIVYDNSILPSQPTPGDVRVATPPRSLTLDKYSFPGVTDYKNNEAPENDETPEGAGRHNEIALRKPLDDERSLSFNPSEGGEVALSSSQEISHLRREMAKLNRRLMTLERDNSIRAQKEKIICGVGLAYFFLKVMVWLNRSY